LVVSFFCLSLHHTNQIEIMYKLFNKIEDKIIFEGTEAEFIHLVRLIAVENEDEELSIISIGEAKDYIENYCDNLELIK
jgi:hypothetical protein